MQASKGFSTGFSIGSSISFSTGFSIGFAIGFSIGFSMGSERCPGWFVLPGLGEFVHAGSCVAGSERAGLGGPARARLTWAGGLGKIDSGGRVGRVGRLLQGVGGNLRFQAQALVHRVGQLRERVGQLPAV